VDDVDAATSAEEVTALLHTLDAEVRRAFKSNSAALPKDPAAGQLDHWKQRVDALTSPTAKELVAKLKVYHEAALKDGGLDVDSTFCRQITELLEDDHKVNGTKDPPTAMKCVALALYDPLRVRTLVRTRVPAVVAAAAAATAGFDFARSQPAAAGGGGGAHSLRAGGGGMGSANATATLQRPLPAAAPPAGVKPPKADPRSVDAETRRLAQEVLNKTIEDRSVAREAREGAREQREFRSEQREQTAFASALETARLAAAAEQAAAKGSFMDKMGAWMQGLSQAADGNSPQHCTELFSRADAADVTPDILSRLLRAATAPWAPLTAQAALATLLQMLEEAATLEEKRVAAAAAAELAGRT
jgi:hypothetical protein